MTDFKIENPYQGLTNGRWLRGNLHAHTTRSDGRQAPQEVVDAYAARGHDFLMLSDHDIYTSPEMLAELDARGMTLIPGNEISAGGPHLLHVDSGERIAPDRRRQAVLNAIAAAGKGFAVICHPNWQAAFDHASIRQLREWVGYAGLEIYNGVIDTNNGSSYATDKWDMLLGDGLRAWGFCNDDSHGAVDVGRGWNVVYAESGEPSAIVDALARGRFYGSTGVVIDDIQVDGRKIRIETGNAEKIVARSLVNNRLKRFAEANGACIEVEVPPDAARYVRFECWGRGEQFAWTQPFYLA